MEANGLPKSNLPVIVTGYSIFRRTSTPPLNVDDLMMDVATALAPSTPDRSGGASIVVHTAMDTCCAAKITPTCSRDNSDYQYQECTDYNNAESSSKVLKGVCDNVALAQARIKEINDRIAQPPIPSESMALLKNKLFAEKICLIDALVIMGWEHYRYHLDESSSYEKSEASVKHIFEEALDISIQLFCSDPQSSSDVASMNLDRLMILLMALDFDEYCETLLQYQLAREHIASQKDAHEKAAVVTTQNMEALLRPTGSNYLRQLHELWKRGVFDRFDPTANEEEEGFAKVHATGLCLVLFRKLESMVDRQQTTDLTVMEEQFKVLFDNYLPTQLTQRPSMNNIVATKYSRLLFLDDGSPTVYWSLLADSYRKEWGDYFDQEEADSADMETDDEDDGL
mmetsp:Transcript_6064/g.12476  ORF Transcript_6064/g.12476 Transcript_6064/m.12476 type:complete len:398 (-) Transcript_6064:91-1284(-)